MIHTTELIEVLPNSGTVTLVVQQCPVRAPECVSQGTLLLLSRTVTTINQSTWVGSDLLHCPALELVRNLVLGPCTGSPSAVWSIHVFVYNRRLKRLVYLGAWAVNKSAVEVSPGLA